MTAPRGVRPATPTSGTLTYFRLFNGMLKPNDTLFNLIAATERIGSLMTMRGETQLPLDVLHAGDIGVVAKLRDTNTGHTLAAKAFKKFITRPKFSMPIYAVALHPRTQSDSAKMGEVLTGLSNADPTLHWYQDGVLKQTILEGMGGTHIDIAISRAERMGVGLDTSVPKVPYQETVTKSATAVYRHKKQTGGAGQFAGCICASSRCRRRPGTGGSSSSSSATKCSAARSWRVHRLD